jgi:hypothetical protein
VGRQIRGLRLEKKDAIVERETALQMMISSPNGGQKPTGGPPCRDRNGIGRSNGISPRLASVSETMLWALHNCASEARRPNGVLTDPESTRIHDLTDYDFVGHFGNPRGSLTARAAEHSTRGRNRSGLAVVA